MKAQTEKTSLVWIITILIISVIAAAIGNYITRNNIAGGIILVLILILIPFSIEWLRKKDPIKYYGLEIATLKTINLKQVLSIALGIFIVVSLIDHFGFDLFNIITKPGSDLSVGAASTALAKSNVFYLAVIVLISGTFLEELWFRGLIQYKINSIKFLSNLNPHFAIISQSVLFGLIHFVPVYYGTDLSQGLKFWFLVYPFFIGLIIGYVNEKYQSLWPGWIIHYTNNVLAVALLTVLFRI